MLAILGILFKAHSDTQNSWLLVTIIILSLLCASQPAIAIVNFFATLWVKPHLLPRMNFSKNIPATSRTLVVVPVMLTDNEATENLIEAAFSCRIVTRK